MKASIKLLESGKVFLKLFLIQLLLCNGVFLYGQDAQQPSLMIIPSDNQLSRLGCIDTSIVSQGEQIYVRNYQKAFIEDESLKFAIAAIQGKFAQRGFPLEDMENTLKQIQNERGMNSADDVMVDMRALLLQTARPDMILELTYAFKNEGLGNFLTFQIKAIDAYTNEVVSTAQHPGLETIQTNVAALLAEQVEQNIQNFQTLMQKYFDDIKANGRKISLRVTVSGNSFSDLTAICDNEDEEYIYLIHDWVKKNSLGRKFKQGSLSDVEVRYTNIRIPLYDEEGYPMAATDWIRILRKYMRKTCDVKSKDRSTGLGGGVLMLMFDQ